MVVYDFWIREGALLAEPHDLFQSPFFYPLEMIGSLVDAAPDCNCLSRSFSSVVAQSDPPFFPFDMLPPRLLSSFRNIHSDLKSPFSVGHLRWDFHSG